MQARISIQQIFNPLNRSYFQNIQVQCFRPQYYVILYVNVFATTGDASEDKSDSTGKADSAASSKGVDQIRPLPSNPSQTSIPLQRLVQSVKQTKRIGSKILKEGWLVSSIECSDNMIL